MTLGEMIRERRGGRRQGEVARAIGIKQSHLCQIEKGRIKSPGIELLKRITTVLGVDLNMLGMAVSYNERIDGTPMAILEKLKMSMPVEVPVLSEYRNGALNGNVKHFVYLPRDMLIYSEHRLFALELAKVDLSQCTETAITPECCIYFAEGLEPKPFNHVLCTRNDDVSLRTFFSKEGMGEWKMVAVAIRGTRSFI